MKCEFCDKEAIYVSNWEGRLTGWTTFSSVCADHAGLMNIFQTNIVKEYIIDNPGGPFTVDAVQIWWYDKQNK